MVSSGEARSHEPIKIVKRVCVNQIDLLLSYQPDNTENRAWIVQKVAEEVSLATSCCQLLHLTDYEHLATRILELVNERTIGRQCHERLESILIELLNNSQKRYVGPTCLRSRLEIKDLHAWHSCLARCLRIDSYTVSYRSAIRSHEYVCARSKPSSSNRRLR